LAEKFPPKNQLKKRPPQNFSTTTIFLDLVGFSRDKTSAEMNQQSQDLTSALYDTLEPHYNWDEERKENDLVMSPTGDGYAITFHRAVEGTEVLAKVRDIYSELVRRRKYEVRFGISAGHNFLFIDLNDVMNVVGWGITMARRVMDEAKPNQILCEASFADPLKNDVRELRPIGMRKTKWNYEMRLYNYKRDEIGIADTQDS